MAQNRRANSKELGPKLNVFTAVDPLFLLLGPIWKSTKSGEAFRFVSESDVLMNEQNEQGSSR